MRPRYSFLRRMIGLLHSTRHPSHRSCQVRLNTGIRSDLAWWWMFVRSWNRASCFLPPSSPSRSQDSDRCIRFMRRGAWHQASWFQIAVKELIPVILACTSWGHIWHGCQVLCHCGNQTVVACLQSRTSKHNGTMLLVRCLVFVEAQFQFSLCPLYINTKLNILADDLYRDNFPSFLAQVPQANRHPSPIS